MTGGLLTLYRILLLLLPRALRREWGREMEAVLARRLTEEPTPVGRARVAAGAVADLLVQAVAVRWAGARRRWGMRKGRRAGRGGAGGSVGPPGTGTRAGRGGGVEMIARDIRFAVRGLTGSPAFTLVAVLTLALGVGANSAVFTVVNAVLLQPLPYAEADRLVSVWPETNFNVSMVKRVEREVPALAEVAGISHWEFTLVGDGEPEKVTGGVVSADYFQLLGVEPALGRSFLPGEDDAAQAGVVVLSHGLWMRRYGGDPSAVGRAIRVGGYDFQRRTIVGVMPAGHRPATGPDAELWVPLHGDSARAMVDDDSWYVNRRVGRLAPGATVEQATSQLRGVAAAIRSELPSVVDDEAARTASVVPLLEARVGDMGRTLWLLLGAVGLVLLVACANVANLMLARGEARERDLAVRRALGAGGPRLVSGLLAESLLLGLAGGLLGLLLAGRGTALLQAIAPADFPRAGEIGVDTTVVAFTLGASLLATLLTGVVPAVRATRRAPGEALRASGRGSAGVGGASGGSPLSRWLVTAQVALAVLLVTGSGLMLRSLDSLHDVDPGFDADGLLVYRLSPPEERFEEGDDAVAYYRRVMERVASVPGVVSVSGIHLLPMTGANWSFPVHPEGVETPAGEPTPTANFRVVHPGYFETMAIGVVAGRAFGPEDDGGAPAAAVVNRAFVERFWPGLDPLGRGVRIFSADAEPYRVVGVVEDVHQHGLAMDPLPELYLAHPQWNAKVALWITARIGGDPMELAAAVREATWEVDAEVPLTEMERMTDVMGRSAGSTRFVTVLLAAFGGLALLLAAAGVYGVTSYTVARRVPELGVRMALGASTATVLAGALRSGLVPVALGLGLGLAAAIPAGRLVESLLFGVEPADPLTLAGVCAVLAATAVVATWLPARRASRVDPARVLRSE